jgi:hypothetical protein
LEDQGQLVFDLHRRQDDSAGDAALMSKRAGSTIVEVAATLIKDAANGVAKEIIRSAAFAGPETASVAAR